MIYGPSDPVNPSVFINHYKLVSLSLSSVSFSFYLCLFLCLPLSLALSPLSFTLSLSLALPSLSLSHWLSLSLSLSLWRFWIPLFQEDGSSAQHHGPGPRDFTLPPVGGPWRLRSGLQYIPKIIISKMNITGCYTCSITGSQYIPKIIKSKMNITGYYSITGLQFIPKIITSPAKWTLLDVMLQCVRKSCANYNL